MSAQVSLYLLAPCQEIVTHSALALPRCETHRRRQGQVVKDWWLERDRP